MRRSWGRMAPCLLVMALLPRAPAAAQTPGHPRFVEAACALDRVPATVAARLQCGMVSVDREPGRPEAGRFALAVVIVHTSQPPAAPDPVVYISGGPGGPLTVYAQFQAVEPYAPHRDLILVDQRGTGRSEPALCPELNGALLEAAVALAIEPTPQTQAARRAAYGACRDAAALRGIDLQDFGTTVTAADFEQVRQALGIEHWNLYGESYGTTVAMTLMALHPGAIRSAVLDSLYPPDSLHPPERGQLWSSLAAAALAAFFDACSKESACAQPYPDLAGLYRETVEQLQWRPLPIRVPPAMHQPGDHVPLTASLFQVLVANLVYYPPNYPSLPRLIAEAHDGSAGEWGRVAAEIHRGIATQNLATHAAVECRDRPHYRNPLPSPAHPLDQIQLYGICDGWSSLGPSPLVPTGTAIPTLVLSGQFDPVSGPSLSRQWAERLGPKAQWIEVLGMGHNVRHFSACGITVVAHFIDHPDDTLDASCADHPAPIPFRTRATLQVPPG